MGLGLLLQGRRLGLIQGVPGHSRAAGLSPGRRLGRIQGGAGLGACPGGLGLLPRGRRLGRIRLRPRLPLPAAAPSAL